MRITGYKLFLDKLEVQARIGIHDFERIGPQRLAIAIEIEIAPEAIPVRDDIGDTLDYDWVREAVRTLVASRHFDLQETLARAIVEIIGQRREVRGLVVETAKPDVFPDVGTVGCRLVAQR